MSAKRPSSGLRQSEGAGHAVQPLQVVNRDITELTLDLRNPRVHRAPQIRQIANSIAAFGFNVPVLIDRAGKVIAGHGRVLACQRLGYVEVPTICLDHLTEAQARAFMVADNRLNENSTWDEQLLGETLRELSLEDLDFSIEATGFEMGEIDLRIEALNETPEPKHDPADEAPPIRPGPAVSQSGDIWLLGRHRVICGSATEPAVYQALLQDRRAAMIFSDPPYNVRIAGHVSGLGAIQHREFTMASGEMTEAEFTTFLETALGLLARYSREASLHYICMDWRHLQELLTAGRRVYAQLANLCVWAKDNGGMGSLYRSQHELVLVFKHGRGAHRNNVELGRFGRNRTNVWSYPGVNSFRRTTEEGNLLALHPTVKPVALVADAMLDCTSRGDVVLDAFLGSGTTLMAAERTGRCCFGVELDPLYVDTIIRRFQAYTGESAIHAISGRSFDELGTDLPPANRPTAA